jgi:hypothetical protein
LLFSFPQPLLHQLLLLLFFHATTVPSAPMLSHSTLPNISLNTMPHLLPSSVTILKGNRKLYCLAMQWRPGVGVPITSV